MTLGILIIILATVLILAYFMTPGKRKVTETEMELFIQEEQYIDCWTVIHTAETDDQLTKAANMIVNYYKNYSHTLKGREDLERLQDYLAEREQDFADTPVVDISRQYSDNIK